PESQKLAALELHRRRGHAPAGIGFPLRHSRQVKQPCRKDTTILLDEMGEMPLHFQSHFLRVLQDGEYRPLGAQRLLKADCQIIAATNKDLEKEVRKGTFRKDLYYRLTPIVIQLPPLRDRRDDIPLLSRFFLDRFAERTGKQVKGISMPAQTALMNYSWPGNIRELQNAIERAAIMTPGTFINITDLPALSDVPDADTSPAAKSASGPSGARTMDEVLKDHIIHVLAQCNGNRTHAAKILGVSRHALLRKLEKYSITD
ncbi:MAG: sigma 54-interacting transcriptional regulator, partial [Nitrospiraceae bacterium]|nr:sigma 54-interacting transcriptional regulator [Nitrospiraceae bacterium]